MREPLLLTTELTLQLERHIAPDEASNSNANPNAPQIARFGKTVARKERGHWPPSAVYCFNKDDVSHLDEILEFFENISPVFYLVHAGFNSEVGKALDSAGFYMADWTQAILYGLPIQIPAQLPDGITIELVTSASIEEAAEVGAIGNDWAKEWRESAKNGVRHSITQPKYQLFLARYNGEPAGIADLSMGREGWCNIGGAAVLPRFRKKGFHTALIQHRLHEAHKRHCELVVGCANFGSPSFRNQQRLGMRPGYIETTWKKRP